MIEPTAKPEQQENAGKAPPARPAAPSARKGNARLALLCVVFVAAMLGMAYAAVPLYRIFCQVTGYGGTTQQASVAPRQAIDRTFKIRFDSNIGAGLPWKFRPVENALSVRAGEVESAFYLITNLSDRETRAIATFNVTPLSAGAYFNKIDCFCFSEQILAPGESREVEVTFFVDPEIAADPNLDTISTITLSYTFFSDDEPPGAAKSAVREPRKATF